MIITDNQINLFGSDDVDKSNSLHKKHLREESEEDFGKFSCQDDGSGQHISYTLVCDFRPDCYNQKDEKYCSYFPLPGQKGYCTTDSLFCGLSKQVTLDFRVVEADMN